MTANVRTLMAAVLLIGLGVPASAVRADDGRAAYYAPSPYKPIRQAMAAAQRDLAKALAAAAASDPSGDQVKAARADLAKSRQDYQDALAAARTRLAADPYVGPLQKAVRDIQGRLSAQNDAYARLSIAGELMKARNALNSAEWNVMGVDPDIALATAAIADAQTNLLSAQSRQQSAIQGDPAVRAARQRIADLRRQLRGH